MVKIRIVLFLVLFGLFSIVEGAQKYRYVCNNDNINCYSTKSTFIDDNNYLFPVEKVEINNFSNFIDLKINDYIDYYQDTTFEIANLCDSFTCSTLEDKELTLSGLLSMNTEFYIGNDPWLPWEDNEIIETYDTGKDYLFSNFSDIINELHTDFPSGDLKSNLDNILINLLSYKGNSNFDLKNVCDDDKCNKSNQKVINFNDIGTYFFAQGEIKASTHFVGDTFKVSEDYNISDIVLHAGESTSFNFGFEDYLDFFAEETEYEYNIYYNFDGEEIPIAGVDNAFLTETLFVNGDNFEISSPNIDQSIIGDFIELQILDEDSKKIRVGVKEGITLSKAGNINFYLSAKNLTSGDSFPVTKINSIPIEVLPNDRITNGTGLITGFFDPYLNSEDVGFNVNQPFNIEFNLLDEFLNEHYDEIDGYDISISNGTSEYLEISKKGADQYSKEIIGLKTIEDNKFTFDFRLTSPGYHDLNGFDIKVRLKNDSNSYVVPAEYFTITNVIPSNLYDGVIKMKIYIKTPIYSTLPVPCGRTVNINYICTSDNYSGCYVLGNTSDYYDSQSQNGTSGQLTIRDNAYNTRIYTYTMNHVDRTAPEILVYKGNNELNLSEYNYRVDSDDLIFKFYEWTTDSCTSKLFYNIQVDGEEKYNGILDGENTEFLASDFFKTSGIKNLYIKATDAYGNFNEKTIKFTLTPDLIDETNSIVTFTGIKNSKYGNNFDEYQYELSLMDQYSNPIYSKQILSLETDCSGIIGCNTIKTILTNQGDDALVEDINNYITTNSGDILFSLKSLAPGIFTEIFKIKIYDWDDSYNNTSTISTYDIGTFSNNNSFLKPVSGSLNLTGGWLEPEIGKLQEYEIGLEKANNNNLEIENSGLKELAINRNSIINLTDGHIWNEFNVLENNFDKDLITKLGFSGSIDAGGVNSVLDAVRVSSNDLKITYRLDGEKIEYYLDDFGIVGCDTETLGLKVIGTLQGDGKSNITGQENNFSDLTKLELKTNIRMNAYKLVKGRESGTIIDGIKYIEGDIDISGDLDYETLIVKEGNVIISGDLNLSNDKLGIIVLKNNYLLDSDYQNMGNIYVDNDVENINAIIYADGTFRSADSLGNAYTDSSLSKNLNLYGSLFTRNTIGGAISAGSTYMLPGGEFTDDYELAEIYDLNFTRKTQLACTHSFLLEYDPRVQNDPPKGFSIK